MLRTYGRPFEITRVTSFDGDVWTWRYKAINTPRLLYIYVDPHGVVRRYHTGDDLMLELTGPRERRMRVAFRGYARVRPRRAGGASPRRASRSSWC